jgi:hypothetical protein
MASMDMWCVLRFCMMLMAAEKIVANLCNINECLCIDDRVICDYANARRPQFTRDERLVVRHMRIDVLQLPYISRTCRLFPALSMVVVTQHTKRSVTYDQCKELSCTSIRITCLFEHGEIHETSDPITKETAPDILDDTDTLTLPTDAVDLVDTL